MAVMYLHLDFEGYKEFEAQAKAFKETTHKSTGGFYHKSLRIKVGKDLIIEFHGPLVGGYGHLEESQRSSPPVQRPLSEMDTD